MAEQSKTVLRYEVPLDSRPHALRLAYSPHAVPAKRIGDTHRVEFWVEHEDDVAVTERTFQVFGTGHPIPTNARLIGTTQRLDGLVWHLYEVYPDGEQSGETPR